MGLEDRHVIQGIVDMRGASGVEEEIDRIELFLQQNGIQDVSQILYTGVKGTKNRIKKILKTGMIGSKSTTYAHSAEDIMNANRNQSNALDYAVDYIMPLILAYDRNVLTHKRRDEMLDNYEYCPTEGKSFRDALLAIIRLKTAQTHPQ